MTGPEDGAPRSRIVTPLQLFGVATGILAVGSSAFGALHFIATRKKLAEEGIDTAARLKAVPVAARALGVSVALCAAATAAAAGGWLLLGLPSETRVADVTWNDVTKIADAQRVLIRREIRRQILGDDDDDE